MIDGVLEGALRRDRCVVGVALALLTALAWAYVLWLAAQMDMMGGAMGDMDMPAMSMAATDMAAPALDPWTAGEFAFMAAMWAVMMIGMMTPSAAPMILIYARVARQAAARGRPFAATGWFAIGYLAAWAGFALAATAAQWALESAALVTPMTAAEGMVGGIVLIAAGLYQWTPLKNSCLAQCQAPLMFIQRHGGFRRDPLGSLRLGARHGGYCVGCCWALMALLFVGGVMNVLWIAALTAVVLMEKLAPAGWRISRILGAAFLGAGVWLLIAA